MSKKSRVIISIIITIILLAAAILIWANQTGRVTIWGSSSDGNYCPPGQQICDNSGVSHACCAPGWHCNTTTWYCDPDGGDGGGGGGGGTTGCHDLTIAASPTSISQGEYTHVTWSGSGECWANEQTIHVWGYGSDGSVSDLGIGINNQYFNPYPNVNTYYKIVSGQNGATNNSNTVIVKPVGPPTVTLSANPSSITSGTTSSLSWVSTNAKTITISPNTGIGTNLLMSGSVSVTPSITTNYTITATGINGTATDKTTIAVTAKIVPKVTMEIKPNSINNGDSSILSWTTENAKSLTITPDLGIGTLSTSGGSTPISPKSNTTYTAEATSVDNLKNQYTASILVNNNSDKQAPTPPVLTGEATSQTDIKLTWTASTDNIGVTGYEIFNADSDSQPIGDQKSGLTWPISGLTCGTEKKYYVKAYDGSNNHSLASNTVTVRTKDCSASADTQAPSKPTEFKAESSDCHSIKLSWKASTDNVGVTGYDIYKSSDNSPITSTDKTDITLTGLLEKNTYGYFVKAHDAAKNQSESSGNVSINTISCGSGTTATSDTTSTTTSSALANLKTLISTGQALWFNIIIAFIVAGIVSYFMFRKRNI